MVWRISLSELTSHGAGAVDGGQVAPDLGVDHGGVGVGGAGAPAAHEELGKGIGVLVDRLAVEAPA